MNKRGASLAFEALVAGDEAKLGELCEWLAGNEGVAGRYLVDDLRAEARAAAVGDSKGGVDALLLELENRTDSMLVAFFPAASASTVCQLSGAWVGPAVDLTSAAPSKRALMAWPERGDTLTVITHHPAQGRLGAIRNADWLQTVLGAIGLASYKYSRTLTPVGLCPGRGSALFLSTASGEPDAVDHAALLSPTPPAAAEIANLFSAKESRDLLIDATARIPSDLVQHRLTLAAWWLQLAASTISTADALVALGIALETISGDDKKESVVEKVTKRSAVFLASSAPADERIDIYYDELKRAQKYYASRSRAAHGRYDPWIEDQSNADAVRAEFHRFVLDVALGFREHARARNMRDSDDLIRWWKRVELEGIFA